MSKRQRVEWAPCANLHLILTAPETRSYRDTIAIISGV
jgi:hypothetical protein